MTTWPAPRMWHTGECCTLLFFLPLFLRRHIGGYLFRGPTRSWVKVDPGAGSDTWPLAVRTAVLTTCPHFLTAVTLGHSSLRRAFAFSLSNKFLGSRVQEEGSTHRDLLLLFFTRFLERFLGSRSFDGSSGFLEKFLTRWRVWVSGESLTNLAGCTQRCRKIFKFRYFDLLRVWLYHFVCCYRCWLGSTFFLHSGSEWRLLIKRKKKPV